MPSPRRALGPGPPQPPRPRERRRHALLPVHGAAQLVVLRAVAPAAHPVHEAAHCQRLARQRQLQREKVGQLRLEPPVVQCAPHLAAADPAQKLQVHADALARDAPSAAPAAPEGAERGRSTRHHRAVCAQLAPCSQLEGVSLDELMHSPEALREQPAFVARGEGVLALAQRALGGGPLRPLGHRGAQHPATVPPPDAHARQRGRRHDHGAVRGSLPPYRERTERMASGGMRVGVLHASRGGEEARQRPPSAREAPRAHRASHGLLAAWAQGVGRPAAQGAMAEQPQEGEAAAAEARGCPLCTHEGGHVLDPAKAGRAVVLAQRQRCRVEHPQLPHRRAPLAQRVVQAADVGAVLEEAPLRCHWRARDP